MHFLLFPRNDNRPMQQEETMATPASKFRSFASGFSIGFLLCLSCTFLYTNKSYFAYEQRVLPEFPVVESNNETETKHSSKASAVTSSPALDLAGQLQQKIRVLCWILTQPRNYGTKVISVNSTWAPRCDKYFFVSSTNKNNARDLPFLYVNVHESRSTLWTKTLSAFEYIYDNFLDKYDFFLKADDDTYVIVENIRYLVANVSAESPVYAGRHFKLHVKQGYMSGGAGYILSRDAVRRLVKATRQNTQACRRIQGGDEDVYVGRCLESVGVKVLPSIDSHGSERFHPFDVASHLFSKEISKTHWLKSYNVNPIRYGFDCCSNFSISFHYVNHHNMMMMEYLLYRLRPFGVSTGCHDASLLSNNTKKRK